MAFHNKHIVPSRDDIWNMGFDDRITFPTEMYCPVGKYPRGFIGHTVWSMGWENADRIIEKHRRELNGIKD